MKIGVPTVDAPTAGAPTAAPTMSVGLLQSFRQEEVRNQLLRPQELGR